MTVTIEPVLDASQRAAVEITPGERQIVLAGPGAGKSHVVKELCSHLVDEQALSPAEILVISFSRAAVGVVRRRVEDVVEFGDGVDVSTIDALAGRVIDELGEPGHVFRGYDQNIECAIRLLKSADESVLGDYRHLIVDEVQDVVGVRAEFVLQLLKSGLTSESGFTLLGDPLQSLYDFQMDRRYALDGTGFLDLVRGRFEPITRFLEGDYRSKTEDARRVSSSRTGLLGLNPEDRLVRLKGILSQLVPAGAIDGDLTREASGRPGSTAFLCDTNARAALVTAALAEHGLVAERASTREDPGLEPWLAQVFAEADRSRVDFEWFAEKVEALTIDRGDAWARLIDVSRSRRELDLSQLMTALRTRGRREFPRTPKSNVLVSTVHRAKGLEFDTVILVDPEDWGRRKNKDVSVFARELYVALSRSRAILTHAEGPRTWHWRRDKRGGRWVRSNNAGKGVIQVIMEPADARWFGPGSVDLTSLVGKGVEWCRTDDLAGATVDSAPSWLGVVAGTPIARTGVDFGEFLLALARGNPDRIPDLQGGRIEGVETCVHALPGAEQVRPWLSARVGGPIFLDWSKVS